MCGIHSSRLLCRGVRAFRWLRVSLDGYTSRREVVQSFEDSVGVGVDGQPGDASWFLGVLVVPPADGMYLVL